MVGSRSQGQVTSSSEIGLGNGQGQPGNTMGQAGLGQGQGQQPTKDVTPGEAACDQTSLSYFLGNFSCSYFTFSNVTVGLLQLFQSSNFSNKIFTFTACSGLLSKCFFLLLL